MKRHQGFTLIELLTVLAIIAILAGIVVKASAGDFRQIRNTNATLDLMVRAVQRYYAEFKSFKNNPAGTDLDIDKFLDDIMDPDLRNQRTGRYVGLCFEPNEDNFDFDDRYFLDDWGQEIILVWGMVGASSGIVHTSPEYSGSVNFVKVTESLDIVGFNYDLNVWVIAWSVGPNGRDDMSFGLDPDHEENDDIFRFFEVQ